jgi:hypothetical protein
MKGVKNMKSHGINIIPLSIFALLLLALAGCSSPAATAVKTEAARPPEATSGPETVATAIPSVTSTPQKETYSDPFVYCQAAVNQDAPDKTYAGPKMPAEIVQALQKVYKAPTDTPAEVYNNGSSWRCMDGKVYACFVGANLPCQSKANSEKTPNAEVVDFCKSHSDSEFIPAAVTGHDTIYEWRCNKDVPETTAQLFHVDGRGYISEIWYLISR